MATSWWNPFDGDVIPGINVGNAVKQVTTGKDYDIIEGVTNSNRPGQVQINGNYDYGVRPSANLGGGGGNTGGGGGGGGDSQVLGSGTGAPAGGAVAPVLPELNMGAIRNTQRAIDEIPGLLEAALAAERTRRGNVLKTFDAQEGQQRKTYDGSTVTNQQNYDGNYMDSIRAGIGGLGGLMNILRGTGASGGTAEEMVRDTVGGVTSNDIRSGADTRNANQTELDTVLSNFLTDLKGKRQAADDTFENNQRAMRRDSQTQLQDLYGKMAGYYGDAKRTDQANSWMDRAGDLTPKIAGNSRTQQSAYDTKPVQVAAPQLTDFAAPSQPDMAVAPQDGQVGSGIFTMGRRPAQDEREERQTPVALPVGA
jgi:hypothetical protein